MATEGRSSDAASAPTPKVKVSVPGTEDTSVTVAAIKPVSPLLREAHGLGLRGRPHGTMCASGCIENAGAQPCGRKTGVHLGVPSAMEVPMRDVQRFVAT